MSARTDNFGLNIFGPSVPGSITDDGSKFTLGDRILIDRILLAMEQHDHKGGVKLDGPAGSPALSLDTVAGQLPAGLNVYYRIAYVDQYGLETAASPEAVIATPTPLAAPSFPLLAAAALDPLSTAPGLGAGLYTYGLTVVAGGEETPLGLTASLTLDGVVPTVVGTFPDVQPGQDFWGVWRRGPGESAYTFVGQYPVTDATFLDDGSTPNDPQAGEPSHSPPTSNSTSATSAITVVVPDPALVAADPSLVKSWRLYRTFTSGVYGASSLLAEVVTTVNADGTGGLLTELTDDGSLPLQPGLPLDVSQTLMPSQPVVGGGGGEELLFTDAESNLWRVLTDTSGVLITERVITVPPAGSGPPGPQGAVGSQGPQGAVGGTGAQGPQGSQGFQGALGPQGIAGAQGSQGFQGSTGSQGSQGFQGATGPAGSTVASGVSVTTSGLVIITHTDVQAALADLDAWASTRPTAESGLLTAMPANGSRPDNSTYFATDQNSGTVYRMVAGVWQKQSPGLDEVAGVELGYAELTTTQTVSAHTISDLPTPLSTTVTVGTRPIRIIVYAPQCYMTTAATALNLVIAEGATVHEATNITTVNWGVNNILPPIWVSRRLTPSAGTHTYKVQAYTGGTGVLNMFSAGSRPSVYIQVVTV